MEKAFDFKALGEKLKDKGLPVLENTAEQAYEAVKEWLIESGQIKGGLVQGIIGVAIPAVDGYVKEQLDKIDGNPG
jgi:hypothetical protein